MSRGQIRYGDSSFRTIIENKYRYIDKTEAIYRMISTLVVKFFYLGLVCSPPSC